jgi:hypothetical protein
MSNPQPDVETVLIRAVQDFLDGNHGATLVRIGKTSAIVATPGLTRSQTRGHVTACVLTLGLWVPVFAMVAILHVPKQVLIQVDDRGNVWSWDLYDGQEQDHVA